MKSAPAGKTGQKQRRAFSVPRERGRVDGGGEPYLAKGLVDALRAAQKDRAVSKTLTHPLHTYPARMHPATARELVEGLSAGAGSTIFDPFCGSGTTLVEARHHGAEAIGSDLNPLAISIARAKTWTAPASRRKGLVAMGREIVARSIEETRRARRSGYVAPEQRTARGVKKVDRDRALAHWFAPHVRRELEYIAMQVEEVRSRDEEAGDILRVLLSSTLYKVSRRTSDTDPTRIERRVARGAATRLFSGRIDLLSAGLAELVAAAPKAPMPRIFSADARQFIDAGIREQSCDLIVTSPPYAGTYDYADQHGLRLAFLGISEKRFVRHEIGSRRNFTGNAERREKAMNAWRRDLRKVMGQIEKALKPEGRAAILIGDSLAGGRAVRGDEEIEFARAKSMKIDAWAWQERPVHTAGEKRAFTKVSKREHLLVLSRA